MDSRIVKRALGALDRVQKDEAERAQSDLLLQRIDKLESMLISIGDRVARLWRMCLAIHAWRFERFYDDFYCSVEDDVVWQLRHEKNVPGMIRRNKNTPEIRNCLNGQRFQGTFRITN